VDPDPIGIILVGPDSDPDLFPFQPNAKPNYNFSRKFQYTFQNSENYDTNDAEENDKTM
jgi:hypothetical protein